MMIEALISAFVTLLVVIDPIGVAPLFMSLTPTVPPAERR
jgi:multiple antibiotic resistance protein